MGATNSLLLDSAAARPIGPSCPAVSQEQYQGPAPRAPQNNTKPGRRVGRSVPSGDQAMPVPATESASLIALHARPGPPSAWPDLGALASIPVSREKLRPAWPPCSGFSSALFSEARRVSFVAASCLGSPGTAGWGCCVCVHVCACAKRCYYSLVISRLPLVCILEFGFPLVPGCANKPQSHPLTPPPFSPGSCWVGQSSLAAGDRSHCLVHRERRGTDGPRRVSGP